MKAKITALNKDYLVEFKDEDQFVSFLTQHNDKVNNVEIINEDTLPELQKPVQVAKPSMSDGWKTLEKSAFTQKEKGVEKKGMTLGGKYAEFKYEPDKTLDNAADSKVSEPKNDSPALKGDSPEASSVEEEPKAEESKEESPKTEEKKEEPKEEKSEDKEEVKEAANPDRAIKEKLIDIVSENGFDDSDCCFDIFDCMSPESQENFLRKHDYEDIGYAYDDDRELAYDLIDFMNSEDLAKCKVMIEKWKVEADEDIDESVSEEKLSPEEDYKEGYLVGQEAYDEGHYIPADESDIESKDFEKGYEDGYNDAKAGINKFDDGEGEHHGPFDEEEYTGELEEVFQAAGLEEGKIGDILRKGAAISMMGTAVANTNPASAHPNTQTELTNNPHQIEQPVEKEIGKFKAKGGNGEMLDVEIEYKDGSYYDQYGNEWSEDGVESIKNGVIPAGTV